ncbi:MAG: S1 RNA-binding domain-containing protein [Desulfuromonadaceae bacterium]|nr:S1 RNA-binding domain-containing protein [Desulfuromonadaceae bacterium]
MTEEMNDTRELNEDEDFASMFEQSIARIGTTLEPGMQIEGTILQIGPEWAFLDVGQKGEGVLSSAEIIDDEGNATRAVGDKISVYFVSRAKGELHFTTKIGAGRSGLEQYESAYSSGIPVEGVFESEIKGGFSVKLAGNTRAFCPFSQSGFRQTEGVTLLGRSVAFKITQFGERGRNIVVSHRAVQEEERGRMREELRTTLTEGAIVRGRITNIRDFGAFVDIGGIEGLLPISEVSYARVEDINQVLSLDQEVEVAVKKLDWKNNKFSFSLRDTQADPWKKVGGIYKEGEQYPGTVSRLAPFGAFVTLEDGVDGLIHVSRLGEGKRIVHPQDVLQPGQKLEVRIEKIDLDERRISLVPADQEMHGTEVKSYADSAPSGGLGTLGELLKAQQSRKRKR